MVVVVVRGVGMQMLGVRAVSSEAGCASAHDRGVAGRDLELIPVPNVLGELGKQFFGDVDDGAAFVADEVDVAACFELVESGAGAGVDVFDDVEFVEAAEDAVDG